MIHRISYSLPILLWMLGPIQIVSAQIPGKSNTIVVEVTSKTGRIWMDRNLGASEAAKSSFQPSSFGYLYQWGRSSDGHQLRRSDTSKKLSKNNSPGNSDFILSTNSPNDWIKVQNDHLWQGAEGINNPCPVGFRLPTSMEFDAEIATWISKDAKGAITSTLKLPLSGYRSNGDGELTDSGISGDYWTSTVEEKNARGLYFDSKSASTDIGGRAVGVSVRCIKN
jgi:uncharacterized protein (TIGR02145 family)